MGENRQALSSGCVFTILHSFLRNFPLWREKVRPAGADNVEFFALAGRHFCRKKVDRAEKLCNIVGTHAGEIVCQVSAESERSYMRIARALIFFWGKCDQTTSDSGKFRIRRPDVPANQGSPGGGRRPPPGRVPPRHARSLQICSKLFFLPSDTIRAKITPFAAF